ncbi:methyltransferase TYW3-domain-containing protein [Xylariaceae sp. FL0804]|nr:methyltransferase TYW3-domain-containing protein [Xylariaceae sp. FL0804]
MKKKSPSLPSIPGHFALKKARILAQLAVPDADYTDASPKGSVDAGIRHLIDELNGLDGFVTTSSCAGRVSVFVEGRKSGGGGGGGSGETAEGVDDENEGDDGEDADGPDIDGSPAGGETTQHSRRGRAAATAAAAAKTKTEKPAGVGGKGGGGAWLFVSHDPVGLDGNDEGQHRLREDDTALCALLGLGGTTAPAEALVDDGEEGGGGDARLIHFKFEPMALVLIRATTRHKQQGTVAKGEKTCARAARTQRTRRLQILHVLTASPEHAQLLLRCGLQAGFRESGAINVAAAAAAAAPSPSPAPAPAQGPAATATATATPMVAIRSMGLAFESLVGVRRRMGGGGEDGGGANDRAAVSPAYLRSLLRVADARFAENARRIARFRAAVLAAAGRLDDGRGDGRGEGEGEGEGGQEWEDAQARRERKRAEGLRRRAELEVQKEEKIKKQQGQRQQGQEGKEEAEDAVVDLFKNADPQST